MNYGQLKTAIASYSNRTDLAPLFPTFLELAEHRIYAGSQASPDPSMMTPPLRLSSMITVVNPATTSLPADFLELKRISAVIGTLKFPLDFLPLEVTGLGESISGRPAYFTLQGNTIVYSPTFAYDVEMIYYARFATPSVDADTNWLLTNAAAVYMSAILIEVAVWTKDAEMFSQQMLRFVSAMNALQAQDDGNKHSGAQLRIKTDGRRLL